MYNVKHSILGEKIGIPIHVYGPETHATAIVGAALGVRPMPEVTHAPRTTGSFLLTPERNTGGSVRTPEPPTNSGLGSNSVASSQSQLTKLAADSTQTLVNASGRLSSLFDENTKAIVWGQQTKAIQG